MLTYHDIDTMLLESEQYLDELFAELEEMMLGNRKNIPKEVLNGKGQETDVPDQARG